ncbi:MAG: pentapeptide repeat-containing protein [Planctomycetaceae bacterium]|nr:pentapeptide repeat-containing protein [Planctomycetaceae bacterium]
MLRKIPSPWHKPRRRCPPLPALVRANLRRANLRRANRARANLRRAKHQLGEIRQAPV